jgi:cytochrome b subunit of formate dehydrogenase
VVIAFFYLGLAGINYGTGLFFNIHHIVTPPLQAWNYQRKIVAQFGVLMQIDIFHICICRLDNRAEQTDTFIYFFSA